VIIHCPKCSYSRQPTDTAPATECPACGVVFEKLLSPPKVSKSMRQAPPQAARAPKPSAPGPAPNSSTTTCPACGGLVAYGAKSCPHCGKAKPAPKPPKKVTKKHLLIAGGVLVLIFIGLSNKPRPLTADEVVQMCAKEIGMNPQSSTPVSMQDIRAMDTCVNKYGFKTKP